MASIVKGNAVIGQSGGPTAVINQSMVGVVETLREAPEIGKILGCVHGVRGILNDEFIELQDIPQDRLNRIANTPSAALGSSRDKPDEAYCRKLFTVLEKRDVRYFFYIGGNDSSDTCRIINELANEAGYELRCFHVPKTIDNDLVMNDHTPGYGSAAKFVAEAFMGDNLDNRALPGVKINIVMGRHAGFLTAASTLGRRHIEDAPHLVYVPEVAFDDEQFLHDVQRIYDASGRCVIAASEGIHDADGTPIITKLAQEVEQDQHGNVQLSGTGALGDFLADHIRKKLDIKRVRADTFGYLQRSFVGSTSGTDAEEARQVGREAAKAAMAGDVDGSIVIERVSNDPYRVRYRVGELSSIAGKTRHLDREFITDAGNDITPAFKQYASPLVGPLPEIELLRMSRA